MRRRARWTLAVAALLMGSCTIGRHSTYALGAPPEHCVWSFQCADGWVCRLGECGFGEVGLHLPPPPEEQLGSICSFDLQCPFGTRCHRGICSLLPEKVELLGTRMPDESWRSGPPFPHPPPSPHPPAAPIVPRPLVPAVVPFPSVTAHAHPVAITPVSPTALSKRR